jgi:hypothetical protein
MIGSQQNATAETNNAQPGTPDLGIVVPKYRSQENGQVRDLISLVIPYNVLEATYKDVFAALSAENIMHPVKKPGSFL